MRSIQEMQQKLADIEEEGALPAPIAKYMIPIRKKMLLVGDPLSEMSWELKKSDWPEQHKAGINRIVGIDIVWIE